jgi:hypothetical protein
MTHANAEEFARRTLLKQMAIVAGSAGLAPTLLGAASAAAQTQPVAPHHGEETAHETEQLAAYAAALPSRTCRPRWCNAPRIALPIRWRPSCMAARCRGAR